ncbi:histidine kinase [Lyngbya aestuarii]|uniref:histidine kinase n=1 Tax=Lyngbya aestuarii TaxID=118322 RepID=UPI00403D764B
MALRNHKRAVGIFPKYHDAELALKELKDSNFPMERVSVIVRDPARQDKIGGVQTEDTVGNKAEEGAAAGAVTGGTLGGITGLLVGLGALAIPGIGPILLAGAEATAIATTLAGGAIGAAAGGLLGALIGLGIPEKQAMVYNERVSHGDYLVMVEGTEKEIRHAESVLSRRGIQEWGIYDIPEHEQRRNNRVADVPEDEQLPRESHHVTATTTTHSNPTNNRNGGRHYDKYAVGAFPSRQEAERTITELVDSGIPANQFSVFAKDADHIGHLAGVEMKRRVDNYADLGIFEERSRVYSQRVDRGDYLVVVGGTDSEVRRAEIVMNRWGTKEFAIYDPWSVKTTHSKQEKVTSVPEVIVIDNRS